MDDGTTIEFYSLDDEIGETLAEHHDAETEKEKTEIAKRLQILYTMHNDEKRIDNDKKVAKKEQRFKRRELDLKEEEIKVAKQTAKNELVVDTAKIIGWTVISVLGIATTAGISYYSWYMDKNGVIPRSKTHVRPLGLLEQSMKIFKI